MHISTEDIAILEGGLKELLSPQKAIKTSKAKKLSYEEEQEIAEKKWLEQREKNQETGYSAKLISKPYIAFSVR